MRHVIEPRRREVKKGELIRLPFAGDIVKAIDEEKRKIEFIISNASKDRYGDVIEVSGWDLKQYKKNPVVLFGHDSRQPPIGRATRTWKDGEGDKGALRSIAEFMPPDISAFADSIFKMYVKGFLKAVSVGFKPLEYEALDEEAGIWAGVRFIKQELLEFSAVPIPANPEALVDAKSVGIDTKPLREFYARALDDKDEGERVTEVFGVDRKTLEAMHKKAGSGVVAIRVSSATQDELLQKNLERIRQQKANKESLESTTESQEPEEQNPVTEDSTVDEERETETEESLGSPATIIDALPKMEDAATEQLEVERDLINEDAFVLIRKAPETILISHEVLTNPNFPLVSRVSDGKISVTIEGENAIAGYDIVGVKGKGLVAKRTKLEQKEVKPEEPKTTREPAVEEPVVEPVVEEPKKAVKPEAKAVEADDEAATFDERVAMLDAILPEVEEGLEEARATGTKLHKSVDRKLKFLAGYMRELANKIDPVITLEPSTTPPSAKNGAAGEGTEVNLSQLVQRLVASMKPAVETMVGDAVKKQRGRLD